MSIEITSSGSGENIMDLTEEELSALVNVRLEEGLEDSDSDHGADVKKVEHVVKKQQFTGPPRPVQRDPMGRYIPSPGGQPLSALDWYQPGPGDYVPNFEQVLSKAPEYSLRERINPKSSKGTPGPGKYSIASDLNWRKCRGFTLKKRVFPPQIEQEFCGAGPAKYGNRSDTFDGPKYSIRVKPKNKMMPGMVNRLFSAPEPQKNATEYIPPLEDWLKKPQTFGIKHKDFSKKKSDPPFGSATPISKGPAWTMAGGRREPRKKLVTPGPAAYLPKTTIGDGPKAPIGRKIRQRRNPFFTPAPNMYVPDRFRFVFDEPGYTMQARHQDAQEASRPGPCSYNKDDSGVKKLAPAYTMMGKYEQKGDNKRPGPLDYRIPNLDPGIGKSFGLKPAHKPSLSAAPGPLGIDDSSLAKVKKAPAYSIQGKPQWKSSSVEPGPADYDTMGKSRRGRGWSMGRRTAMKATPGSIGPGPAYNVATHEDPCVCRVPKGVTVKGRHTPLKYDGWPRRILPPPKGFPVAPLLG